MRVSWLLRSRIVVLSSLVLAFGARADSGVDDPSLCDAPGDYPDVVVGALVGTASHGSAGDIAAFSIGTTSCNLGTCWLNWIDSTPDHPVIGQNMYRLKDGRFEQLGQSWLKHGFFALSGSLCASGCIGTDGTHLGVNCSDPYDAALNGYQYGLGPKSDVNAAQGTFPYPPNYGTPVDSVISRRLQVHHADLDPALNAGALYFVEGQYVSRDDAAARQSRNNASYRPARISRTFSIYILSLFGSTQSMEPAIRAWKALDPAVVETVVDVPGDGRFILAARATPLGDGIWRYEYALYNQDSHRSAMSFSVPIPAGATVGGTGFHDVDYHSGEPFDGTDWPAGLADATHLGWATRPYAEDPLANALRWGTLYNFRFDVAAPPVEGGGVWIGLFRPPAVQSGVCAGARDEIHAVSLAPASDGPLLQGVEPQRLAGTAAAGPVHLQLRRRCDPQAPAEQRERGDPERRQRGARPS